jgi:membrane fusion protein (multidrug efflux system)
VTALLSFISIQCSRLNRIELLTTKLRATKKLPGLLLALALLFHLLPVSAASFDFLGVEVIYGKVARGERVHTHAIMVASARKPFRAVLYKDQDFYYQSKVSIDDTVYYRLSVGNFTSKSNAGQQLAAVQQKFPGAKIFKRSLNEIEALEQYIEFGPATDSSSLATTSSKSEARANNATLQTLGCMLAPSKKVEVSSPVAGVLEQVRVRRGDRVTSGETLFHLKSTVEKAGVELARVKTEFAARNAERNVDLYQDDLLSINERDEIETELLLSQMELVLREEELALRTVTSPISGVVVDRLSQQGEYVNIDPVIRLATLDPLHVDLLLPADYFGRIKVGQVIKISAAPSLRRAREAEVTTVDPLIDPASGTFRVQLVMSNPEGKIPSGLRCTARLE